MHVDGPEDGFNENMVKGEGERYRAFLLRCWQEGEAWRYSVESAGDEEGRRGFGSLEALVAWLQAALEAPEGK